MRINDIILESNTEEGIGSAIGSIAGGLAKGAGAVVGGIRGAGDAFGKGYTAGRSAVSGDSKQAINQAKAQKLRAQADQLDGGSSAQSFSNSNSAGSTANTSASNNTVSTGNNNTTANNVQATNTNQATTQNSVATPDAEISNPLDNKKFLSSLQHLKGDDVERVRTMLQRKVAMGESVELDEFDIKSMANTAKKGIGNFVKGAKFGYNDPTRATNLSKNPNTGTMTKAGRVTGKLGTQAVRGIKAGAGKAADLAKTGVDKATQIAKATPGAIAKVAKATPGALATAAGTVAATGTKMKHDYQMARGGSMTTQDLHQMIASFSADEAKKVLGFFNTIHDSGEPAQAEPVDQTQATGTDGKPNLKLHKGGLGESRVGYHSRFLGTEI